MNVLIIDDEELLLDIWLRLFKSLSCNTFLASDGLEGVKALKQESIDLVLIDIKMPNADGFHVLNYLKGEHLEVITAIVCSGYIDNEESSLAPYQVARVIKKPFSFSDELLYFQNFMSNQKA